LASDVAKAIAEAADMTCARFGLLRITLGTLDMDGYSYDLEELLLSESRATVA
jgi:hypothetical protein